MTFRFIVLCAILAFANAGGLLTPALSYGAAPTLAYSAHAAVPLSYSAPAITSQSSNIYRSAGNLGQISTFSKTIDTPFSSVSKSDVRISNPGLKFAAAPALAYSAPAYTAHATYAAPTAYTTHGTYAAPAAYATHAAYAAPAAYASHTPLLGVAYSAAPAVAHVAFDSGVSHYAW